MEMTLMEKIITIFKYMISSFMSIEVLLIVLLFFGIIFLNIKRNNKYFKIAATTCLILLFIILILFRFDYAADCIVSVIKLLLEFLYFPHTGIYMTEMIIVALLLVYNIFSKKTNTTIRKINIIVFEILYLLYANFLILIATEDIDITDKISLYADNKIISFVQISNLIFLIWLVFICGYNLYQLFKTKDKEEKGD